MDKITPAKLLELTKINFPALGYPEEDDIQPLIDRSWAWLGFMTGHSQQWGTSMASWSDPDMEPLVEMVTRAKTEVLAYQNQEDIMETAADFMLISSFSAGSYSETRRDIKDLKEARLLDADPRINSVLWALMSPEMRDIWEDWLTPGNAPAFEVTEMIWQPHAGSTYYEDAMTAMLGVPLVAGSEGKVSASEPWQSAF